MSKNNFTYTLQIDAEIQNLLQKTNQVKQAMQGVMNTGKAPGAEKIFGSIEKAIEKLQTKASQPITSIAAFESLQKDAAAVGTSLGKLSTIVEDLGKMGMADKLELLPPDLKQKITEANTALANFSKVQSEAAKKSDELVTAEKDLAKAQKELKSAEGRVADKKALIKAQEAKVANDKAEAAAIKTKIDALKRYQATNAAYEKAGADKRRAGGATKGVEGLNLPKDRAAAQGVANGLGIDLKDTKAVEATLTRLNDQYREASKVVTDAEATQRRYSTQLNEAQNAATVASGKVGALETSVQGLNAEFEKNKAQDTQAAYAQLRAEASRLGVDISNIPLDYTEQNFLELNNAMNQLAVNGIAQVDAGMDNIQAEMEETSTAAKEMNGSLSIAGGEMQKLDATVSNTTAFTSRIAQFVGLQGGIQLARKAMRNAIDTIKELDAAMTEMAVVTDFEVGDYWDQLPRHTADANKLGVAIKDVYEAETLYYQQGLKQNEVVAMSAQTLKMARIAGLSAEDATNKMTAALRGFNMELNETSAERVADVYSELAAITASDVDEISSAMTKTASIAASAGMEFETTAAFLSQIIETTRESAETAGTALKTVIARFQELKKDPSEIGEVDGEIVDANKIETALRSVGVSLRDAQGQFRELDDVFLELSGKWDSLDTNTQRYIATIAAGSRQQSRFIAMMSDYSRTQELVTAANASAGASNQQFEKTMDSLDAKLNELKNAWDSFTMGIMNSDVLKAGIDLITGIMNAINGITDAFGSFSGAAKIGLLVAALYLGDKALKVFMTSLKGGSTIFQAFGKVGKTALEGVKQSFTRLAQATKGTNAQLAKLQILQKNTVGSSVSLKAAQDKVALAERNLATAMRKYGAESEVANVATRRLKQAQTDLAFQEAANTKISQEASAMRYFGISAMEAEMLALQGVTAKEIEAAIAKEMSTGCSQREAVARVLAAYGVQEESKALTLNNLIRQNALLGFLQELGLLLLGRKSWKELTAEENRNTTSKIMQTIATLKQAAANGALLATMGPILLGTLAITLALGALVLIIYLIVKAVEAWKASQPDAQLAALQEKSQQAKEAAEQTKQAYDDLLSAKDEYDSLASQVDNLTEGTTEWKEAVAQLNNQVMELIQAYPILLEYMQIAENGVLSINAEGWEAAIEKQHQAVSRAQAYAYQTQIDTIEKEKEINKHKYRKEQKTRYYVGTREVTQQEYNGANRAHQNTSTKTETYAVLDYDIDKQYQDELEKLSKLTWGTTEYQNAYAALVKTIGEGNTESLEALKAFDATHKKMSELDKEAEQLKRALLSSLGTIEAKGDSNYNRIIESLLPDYDTIQDEAEEKAAEKWKNKGGMWTNGNDTTNDKLKNELAEYGLTSSSSEVKDLNALLKAKGGQGYTDEELANMSDKELKEVDGKLAKQLEELETTDIIGTDYVNKLYELQESNQVFGDLYSGSLDIDLAAAEKQIEALEDVDDVIKNALKNRVATVKQAQKDIDAELDKIYNKTNTKLKMPEFEGYDQKQEFLRTYNEMLSGVGAGMAYNFAELFSNLDPDEQKQFLSAYEDINWSSSIEGAAALKQMLEEGSTELQNFAAKTLLVEQQFFSATSQMNEFYKSLSTETLDELAKDGKITASEILELADSNEQLVTMLDTTGASAATVAKYYELLENGTIKAHEATQNFINALEDLHAASNTIEDSFGFIDTFEPSRSQTEIGEFFSGMRESAMELYEMGAYGDQSLYDYVVGLLGDTNWQTIIDQNNGDMKAALDQAMSQINTYGENMYGAWKNLVQKGLQGVSMGKDGSIQFDMSSIGSIDNLKKQIMDMGWSEAMADALVADAQTFSADLGEQLDELGVAKMFESWLKDAMTIDGKTIIPRSQVQAMAKELRVPFDQLEADLKAEGINVVSWVTEDGKATEDFVDLRNQLIEQAKEAGEFDLDTNYALLLELGLDDAAAKAELATMAGSLSDVPFILNGETVTTSANGTGEILYTATNSSIENATIDGLVSGVQDPKVRAAEELSALNQAEIMAKANAAGSIAAATSAVKATAGMVDKFVNGIFESVGWDTRWNISGFVTSATNSLISAAEGSVTDYFSGKKTSANATLIATTTGSNSSAASNLAGKYANGAYSGNASAYSNSNAQKAGQAQGESVEMWENAYDRLWNLNKQLNTIIRDRENLERQYERALYDSSKTARELAKITADQLTKLKEEKNLQQAIADQAIANAQAYMEAYSKFSGLYSFDTQTGEIQVDWETVGAMGWTSDQGSEFEEFISYLEEQSDTYREATDAIMDIEDSVKEIEERGRESTSTIFDQVKEGLAKQYEDQLDELEDINEGIQEASEAIVSKIQEQIDDIRQAREREKALQNINDKELRLAYLMRNTSGGNATEILSLQKELEEDQQSYVDTLVDDAISNLEEQNDKAAQQRDQQLELQREQLDAYLNSQAVWNDVQRLVYEGFSAVANGTPFARTQAGMLAALGEEVEGMNPLEAEDFYTELDKNAKEGAIHSGFLSVTGAEGATTLSKLATEFDNSISKVSSPVIKVNIDGGSGTKNTNFPPYTVTSGTGTTQKDAIQSGINAMLGFRSGGAGHVTDNSDWESAKKAYVAAGGLENLFYTKVADAIASGDGAYYYGSNYDASQKKITTGTFPGSWTKLLGDGRGPTDTFDVYLKDYAGTVYSVIGAKIRTAEDGLADDSINSALNSLYSGTTPSTGWLAMYKNEPYVYYNGGWREFYAKKNEVRTEMLKYLNPKFKNGGLADFTGPAWLDGTKSKPEIVLNQTDSANFMQLRDILADILHGTSSLTRTDRGEGGDNYYDIAISVDSLGSDYDVEQLADKIRSMIYEDSMYRNVNSINQLR